MEVSLTEPSSPSAIAGGRIEISLRGRWQAVPAFWALGQTIIVTGGRVKIARVHDEEWIEEEVLAPEEYIRAIKANREIAKADIFTFVQKVPHITPCYTYPMELESTAVARVGNFTEWWDALPQISRKNVRRSNKRGVTIRQVQFTDDVICGIAEVQNETSIRQGRRYPHYGKSFEQVKRDHSGFLDHCDFIAAYFDGKIIGFLKVVYRGKVASILQINSMMAHFDKRPSNALVTKAAELCSARGVEYLTYARFNYGNKGEDSLREFKIRNGFEEMLVPRYYVPLTPWGQVSVKCKLYRSPLSILPRNVIRALVAARVKWYDLLRRTRAGVAQ
ncbi:MAG TPA: hypothetical protein VGG56_14195 [Terracidiphilus sp.]